MGYADYTQGTGSGGIMLIRVADAAGQGGVINGNDIQFFLRTTNSGTFVGSPGFGTSVYYNGTWVGLANMANYSNAAGFRHLGTINVTTNQSIVFHINASGTSGFGGPTDFWLAISRATVPAAPTPIGIDNVMHQQFRYRFSGNSDGGAAIQEWQIAYGYDPNNGQYTAPSSGTIDVGTFVVGATIYIWSRGRNSVGWGPWSSRSSVTLRKGGRIKYQGSWYHMIPHVKDGFIYGSSWGTWKPAEPYIKKGKVPGVSDGVWALAEYTG